MADESTHWAAEDWAAIATGLRAIEAEKARVRARPDWADIETAPKDGTEIMGMRCGVWSDWTMKWKAYNGWDLDGVPGWMAGGITSLIKTPTHWRPL